MEINVVYMSYKHINLTLVSFAVKSFYKIFHNNWNCVNVTITDFIGCKSMFILFTFISYINWND